MGTEVYSILSTISFISVAEKARMDSVRTLPSAPSVHHVLLGPMGELRFAEEKLHGDLFCFDLHPGAMQEEVQLIAEMLNRHVVSISLTIFP